MVDPVAPVSTQAAPERTSFVMRMARAAMLHADTYEEIEADPSAIVQSAAVVALACVAAALGFYLRVEAGASVLIDTRPLSFQAAIVGLEPLVIWIGASAFSYMTGASFFRGPETETDFLEVLRTTGFAFTPALLFPLAAGLPDPFGLALATLARLWILTACVVAVRQALDFTTTRAVATYGAAALLMWLVLWGLAVVPVPV